MKCGNCLLLTAVLLVGVVPTVLAGLIPPPLRADESDALTVFRPDGTVFDRLAALEALEQPQNPRVPAVVYILGDSGIANPNLVSVGSSFLVLTDPGHPNELSNEVGVTSIPIGGLGAQPYIVFASDTNEAGGILGQLPISGATPLELWGQLIDLPCPVALAP